GIVEHGLFLHYVDIIICAKANGVYKRNNYFY
ncbi:hypothetical protein ACP6DI_00845, partial [Listeria monocytogenes]